MLKRIYQKVKKFPDIQYIRGKIYGLLSIKFIYFFDIHSIWNLKNINNAFTSKLEINEYDIFGTSIRLDNINWHKDYVSGFEYPLKRFDRIKISKWFNKGIDIKFPWEVSRFYFAIKLAQNYVISRYKRHYLKFKDLVLDWIDNNPFCYGINWHCTMEVAIRAINWVVAANIFSETFEEDKEFLDTFSKSLVQHAEYISTFPEIYENNHTTNHTTADYTGLLFLALTLKGHPKSKEWLKQAKEGLEECIRYQTYKDGVNFEGSIPYHRLVLEMFAYSAIVAKANGIEFSRRYYELLFKMFEYTAAYMDHNGNAPQVGDNDSGRILIIHESDEHDHLYLLDLGEHIFNYKFKSQCKKRNPKLKQWLPKINKINIEELNVKPRETDKSIAFEKGSAYFLKNDNISLMVACFPIGQNGIGGHNHYDMGSFTLSYKGQQIIVDPGTYNYTRSISERDLFRSPEQHNILKTSFINFNQFTYNIWGIKPYCKTIINKFNDQIISFSVKYIKKGFYWNREIILDYDSVIINNLSNKPCYFILNLHPDISIERFNRYQIMTNYALFTEEDNKVSFEVSDFWYSDSYNYRQISGKIQTNTQNDFKIKIKFTYLN